MPNNPDKIEFDALAKKLVPDPLKPDDLVVLRGFVGRSTEEGTLRLYMSQDFSDYVAIQAPDVIRSQQLSSAQSPMTGSVEYVKPDARIWRVQVSAHTEAPFLQAELTSAFAKSAARVALELPVPKPDVTLICATILFGECPKPVVTRNVNLFLMHAFSTRY